jgi:hypothetical protein
MKTNYLVATILTLSSIALPICQPPAAIANMVNTSNNATGNDRLEKVKVGDKWEFVNSQGQMIILPEFDAADNFIAGKAQVRIGNKVGYIDLNGKFIQTLQHTPRI